MAMAAGLARRACPLCRTRWVFCPCGGLQDCKEGLDGQSAWGSFGLTQRVPVCPWPDNQEGVLAATGGLSQYLSDFTEMSQPWSQSVPHQPCVAAASCMHRGMCARDICEVKVTACTGRSDVPLEVVFAFSMMQVGIEANPNP